MTDRTPGFATLAIHAGAQPDPTTGARATPIYQTTSFVFDDVDHAASLFGLQTFGNIYTRIGNPTNAVLEERVAALEGGTAGLAVASGHAAQVLVMHCLMMPGDEFVASKKLYGGSINQFNHAFKSFGWNVVWADPDESPRFERAVTPKTKAIFTESIANPGGVITDIAGRFGNRQEGRRAAHRRQHARHALPLPSDRARRRYRRAFADQVPRRARQLDRRHDRRRRHLQLVARQALSDAVRATSRIHGIVLHETFGNFAFAIACRVLGLRDIGPALSPFNAFLILTGIETLPLRMQRHCDNALAVAEWLVKQPEVAWVSYPGLSGDRYNALAKKYVPKGAGAVFTFGLKGGYDAGVKLVVERQAVLASRQHRRHAFADHPSRLDDASPVVRRRRRCRPAPARTWCGSRSASRTRRTSSPTWSRRWRRNPSSIARRYRTSGDEAIQLHAVHGLLRCARNAGSAGFSPSSGCG